MNSNEIPCKTSIRLKRIQKISGIFKTCFLVLSLAMTIGVSLTFVVLALSAFQWLGHAGANYTETLHAGLAFGQNLVTAVFFWSCYKLFGLYSNGDLFTAEVVRSIRRVGCLYILIIVVGYLCEWILPHPTEPLHWVESTKPIARVAHSLFSAFLILFIAWIMEEGRKLQEEQELTV